MNSPLEPGAMVAGRYRLLTPLGEGGAGVIWAAHDTSLKRDVALKLLKPQLAFGGMVRARFLREARTAYAIRHVNVVHVHDVVEDEAQGLIIVMERLRGETLAAKLSREKRVGWSELREIMLQVFDAVQAAHDAHVVHRDLKPENIFLCEDGEPRARVRVLDFGLAKLVRAEGSIQSAGVTRTGAMLGTPYYMSPEQVFGERWLDHRTDIWSLGVILYECLSGIRPTEGGNVGQIFKRITRGDIVPLREREPTVPSATAALVTRMLALDPHARPANVAEVRERFASEAALEKHVASGTQDEQTAEITCRSAPPTASDWSQSLEPRRERSWRRALVLASALLATGAGVVTLKSFFVDTTNPRNGSRLMKAGALPPPSPRSAGPAVAAATTALAGTADRRPVPQPSVSRPEQFAPPAPERGTKSKRTNPQRLRGSRAAQSAAPRQSGERRPSSVDELFGDPI